MKAFSGFLLLFVCPCSPNFQFFFLLQIPNLFVQITLSLCALVFSSVMLLLLLVNNMVIAINSVVQFCLVPDSKLSLVRVPNCPNYSGMLLLFLVVNVVITINSVVQFNLVNVMFISSVPNSKLSSNFSLLLSLVQIPNCPNYSGTLVFNSVMVLLLLVITINSVVQFNLVNLMLISPPIFPCCCLWSKFQIVVRSLVTSVFGHICKIPIASCLLVPNS